MKRWFHIGITINEDKSSSRLSYYSRCGLYITDSTIHYLLAAEIFRGLIKKYKIDLWRFSRYKYSGEAIVFKFKSYISLEDFRKIKREIKENKLIKGLLELDIINPIVDIPESREGIQSNEKIGSDHDIDWKYTVKESWPYFINGVCKMWLNMIIIEKEKYIREKYINDLDLFTLFDIYNEVRKEINTLWIDSGRNFAYHHTCAIFGFEYVSFSISREDLFYKKSRSYGLYEHMWKFLYLKLYKFISRQRLLNKFLPFRKKYFKGYIKL